MFFVFGINQGEKEIGSFGPYICVGCGSYGRYRVYVTYMCFSLFFLPLFKWGRHYYAEASCCQALYELNPEVGKRLARGEDVEIRPADLTRVQQANAWGNDAWGGFGGNGAYGGASGGSTARVCPCCGYRAQEDFAYCPKCGAKLR